MAAADAALLALLAILLAAVTADQAALVTSPKTDEAKEVGMAEPTAPNEEYLSVLVCKREGGKGGKLTCCLC